jgi:hypothetical protein
MIHICASPTGVPGRSRRILHGCLLSSKFANNHLKDTRLEKEK